MELKPCPDCTRTWGVRDEKTNRFEMRKAHFCGTCGRPINGYEPPNEPLTLEELWEMDGEPVWVCDRDQSYGCYMLVSTLSRACFNFNEIAEFNGYGIEWIAYRRKPERRNDVTT